MSQPKKLIPFLLLLMIPFSFLFPCARCLPNPDCLECDRFKTVGTIENNEVVEASGLAASRTQEGLFWTHNDSGDTPRFFAFLKNGTHRGEFRLQGATAVDWEDLAIGPCGEKWLPL